MRLINWNIERRGPHTWQAASLVSEIQSLQPDLVVLTEAHLTSLESMGGHVLSHRGYVAGPKADSERLVLIWSKAPWTEIPLPPSLADLGGAVLGETEVEGRAVYCFGICIPWHMAPTSPPGEKTQPWKQHELFLDQLRPALDAVSHLRPLIVAGDYNRRMPRAWGPHKSYEKLETALTGLDVVTRGSLPPLDDMTIDHVATRGDLHPIHVRALDRKDASGRARSDHFGILVDFD